MDNFLNLYKQVTSHSIYQISTADSVPDSQDMQFDDIVKIPVAVKCPVSGPL